MNTVTPRFSSVALDRIGACLSLVCAIHCLVTPILIGFLPVIGLEFLAEERTELLIFAAAAIVALAGASLGWRLHRCRSVVIGFGLAIGAVVLGRVLGEGSVLTSLLIIGGGFGMALCHLVNLRLCRRCERCAS